jgi:hypothetical protein
MLWLEQLFTSVVYMISNFIILKDYAPVSVTHSYVHTPLHKSFSHSHLLKTILNKMIWQQCNVWYSTDNIYQGWSQCSSCISLIWLAQNACKKELPKFLIHKILEQNTSTSRGFLNKQYFLVLLSESAGYVLSGSVHWCYYTFDLINKYMALA